MRAFNGNNGLLAYEDFATPIERRKFQNNMLDEASQAVRVYLKSGIMNHRLQELVRCGKDIERANIALKVSIHDELNKEIVAKEILVDTVMERTEELIYLEKLRYLLQEYRTEHKKREEYSKFDVCAKEYKKLPCLTKFIADKGTVALSQIECELPVSKRDLQKMINSNAVLFSLRENKNQMVVSLSGKGKRFQQYTASGNNIATIQSQQLSYENCVEIIRAVNETFENDKGTITSIKLHGLSEGQDRALQQEYGITMKKYWLLKAKGAAIFPNKAIVSCPVECEIFKPIGEKNERHRIGTKGFTWK